MKSLKMGKMLDSIRRKTATSNSDVSDYADTYEPSRGNGNGDGSAPEVIAAQNVKAFCESGGSNNDNGGDEVLFLPPIVDAAESSPVAAADCARLIRKYLKKDHWTRASYQYNAIMLMRILADNPGPTFTRNLDQKFADTTKDLLRAGRDPSVHQMLIETLEMFATTKTHDENLGLLMEMWRKEKEKMDKQSGVPVRSEARLSSEPGPKPIALQPNFKKLLTSAPLVKNRIVPASHFVSPLPSASPSVDPHSQNYFTRNHKNRKLPEPAELSNRTEEARTSAKLLEQVVKNTEPGEFMDNGLIKEFVDRCTSASRSIQLYMVAENPAPGNDAMENLIDTNEQLQAALHLHQRSVLNARKYAAELKETEDAASSLATQGFNMNTGERTSRPPSPSPPSPLSDDDYRPSLPKTSVNAKGKAREYDDSIAGPSRSHTPASRDDPFEDPRNYAASTSSSRQDRSAGNGFATNPKHRRAADNVSSTGTEETDIYDATPPPSTRKDPMYRY